MNKINVTIYSLGWHHKSSDSMIDIIVKPFTKYISYTMREWDGHGVTKDLEKNKNTIFWMIPPNPEDTNTLINCTWVPMWDQAQGYSQEWWNSLPKNLKIISFSKNITKMSKKAGLRTFEIKYYCNPKDFEPTDWSHGISIFYWNRVGLIGPRFVKKINKSLNSKKMTFRPTIDPRIDKDMYYNLPDRIGGAVVKTIEPKSKEEYINLTKSTNVYIAPRKSEGIGMSFLEAMARGSAVVAFDAPTMNEYIDDGKNGILLNNNNNVFDIFRKKFNKDDAKFIISPNQNWIKIAGYDFQEIGNQARIDSAKGYEVWKSLIPELARFIIDE
jgi:hypothetical protein